MTKTKVLVFLFLCATLASCSSSSSSQGKTCSSASSCRLFLTATSHKGNLGGLSGADVICANDTNNPKDGATFKALLLTSTRNPKTSGGNWVLFKTKEYQRLDGTVVGTTTDESIFSTLTASWAPINGSMVWTGAEQNWDVGSNCNDWTSESAPDVGQRGRSHETDVKGWSYSAGDCSHSLYTGKVLCVEQ